MLLLLLFLREFLLSAVVFDTRHKSLQRGRSRSKRQPSRQSQAPAETTVARKDAEMLDEHWGCGGFSLFIQKNRKDPVEKKKKKDDW